MARIGDPRNSIVQREKQKIEGKIGIGIDERMDLRHFPHL
jgi:hypothetical protein